MNAQEFSEFLLTKNACEEGIKWASGKSLAEAWELLDRPDWMLWLYGKNKNIDKKICVQIAVYSARLCLDIFEKEYPDDDRPRKAIEAAENWIANPTEEAIFEAYSAADSAWIAAESALSSAYSAVNIARSSAESAAWSAESADNAAHSACIAKESVKKQICDYIRSLIKISDMEFLK